jgi:hypothetical protein
MVTKSAKVNNIIKEHNAMLNKPNMEGWKEKEKDKKPHQHQQQEKQSS